MYATYEYETAKYRILLEKWSPKLHPNHFQVDLFNQNIFQMQILFICSGAVAEKALGNIYEWHSLLWPGENIPQLDKLKQYLNQIREKIILQEEFLEKYDLVDPGLTK